MPRTHQPVLPDRGDSAGVNQARAVCNIVPAAPGHRPDRTANPDEARTGQRRCIRNSRKGWCQEAERGYLETGRTGRVMVARYVVPSPVTITRHNPRSTSDC